MGSHSNKPWSSCRLRDLWISLFNDEFYTEHSDDINIQAIILLMEGAKSRVKQLAVECSELKSSNQKTLLRLEEKDKECTILKQNLRRMKRSCEKCVILETELKDAKRKMTEAQMRMDSIAKILIIGDNLAPTENERRNSAMNLVSQMLLNNDSPKRKRRCSDKREPLYEHKDEILAAATIDVLTEKQDGRNGVIVETMPPPSPLRSVTNLEVTPTKRNNLRNFEKSPILCLSSSKKREKLSTSVNIPPMTGKKVSTRKNLSADFKEVKEEIVESPKKKLLFNIENVAALDASLMEYVREGSSQLEKIWFRDDNIKSKINEDEEKYDIVVETPTAKSNSKQHKGLTWLLREKNGVSKETSTNGNRLKQLKLGVKTKAKENLDISKMIDSSKRSACSSMISEEEDEIIANSPISTLREPSCNLITKTENNDSANTSYFKPVATSTQKEKHDKMNSSFDKVPNRDETESVKFIYKRGAVRKQEERKKLEGWDCEECAKYYSGLGKDVSPSEIKKRMNSCSKHRDKFKPQRNQTPPGFWNPMFPDTEECKAQGMYRSVCIDP